jgi:hypothetical protein
MTETRVMNRGQEEEEGAGAVTPCHTLSVSARQYHDRVHAERRVVDKSCNLTIVTGTLAMIGRPDITAGLSDEDLSMLNVLQMASGMRSSS